MAVPQPPRIVESLDTIPALANALVAYQQWATQLYNSVRPSVLQMERIALLAKYEATISNPPTKAEVESIQALVNAIIDAARTRISGQ